MRCYFVSAVGELEAASESLDLDLDTDTFRLTNLDTREIVHPMSSSSNNADQKHVSYAAADQPAPGTVAWLIWIMRRLLAPDGCPWDREQTLASLKPFLIEEAHEVLDAIDEGDLDHHCEELGDLLFQIIFQAELANISLSSIIEGIGKKLIRRHPHVFSNAHVDNSAQVVTNWEKIKQKERGRVEGLLRGVPRSMPSLQRAHRLTQKAAKVGFDWPDEKAVRAKVREETQELEQAIAEEDQNAIRHELGDLLFALANWGRKLGFDPEVALGQANARFEKRFAFIESPLAKKHRTLSASSLEEMDRLWEEAKKKLG